MNKAEVLNEYGRVNMKILSLDPSSSCTGYALMEHGGKGLNLIEGGTLRGKAIASAPDRVLAMRVDLLALLNEFRPSVIIVEIPTEKQYTRKQGKRSGMAVWGGAAWALWIVAVGWAEDQNETDELLAGFAWKPELARKVHPINNTLWTAGTDKEIRKAQVRGAYPHYDPAADPGGDVADAIAMALWWRVPSFWSYSNG